MFYQNLYDHAKYTNLGAEAAALSILEKSFRHLKVRVWEHQGVSPRTSNIVKGTLSISVSDHMNVLHGVTLKYWGESQTTGSWRIRRVYSLKETNHHLIRIITLRNCFYFNLQFVSSTFMALCFAKFEYLVVNIILTKVLLQIIIDVIDNGGCYLRKLDMLNRNWVFILLFSDFILSLLISITILIIMML